LTNAERNRRDEGERARAVAEHVGKGLQALAALVQQAPEAGAALADRLARQRAEERRHSVFDLGSADPAAVRIAAPSSRAAPELQLNYMMATRFVGRALALALLAHTGVALRVH
jgi:hypothetical protein